MQQNDTDRKKDPFPNRRQTRIILSILTLFYAVGLVVALFFSFASPLILVSGPADKPLLAWTEAILYCTCPVTFIIAIVGGWLSYSRQRYRLALTLAYLPIFEVILIFIGNILVNGRLME